jgi:hypothetical protein
MCARCTCALCANVRSKIPLIRARSEREESVSRVSHSVREALRSAESSQSSSRHHDHLTVRRLYDDLCTGRNIFVQRTDGSTVEAPSHEVDQSLWQQCLLLFSFLSTLASSPTVVLCDFSQCPPIQ